MRYNAASREGDNGHRSIAIMRSIVSMCGCAAVVGLFGGSGPAQAQEGFLGEVIFLAENFCPRGTLKANGAVLPITQYPAIVCIIRHHVWR